MYVEISFIVIEVCASESSTSRELNEHLLLLVLRGLVEVISILGNIGFIPVQKFRGWKNSELRRSRVFVSFVLLSGVFHSA